MGLRYCASLLIVASVGLVLLLQMPATANAARDVCKMAGHFKSQECKGFFFRCIYNNKIRRWILYRKPCQRNSGSQWEFDESRQKCGPPTDTPTTAGPPTTGKPPSSMAPTSMAPSSAVPTSMAPSSVAPSSAAPSTVPTSTMSTDTTAAFELRADNPPQCGHHIFIL